MAISDPARKGVELAGQLKRKAIFQTHGHCQEKMLAEMRRSIGVEYFTAFYSKRRLLLAPRHKIEASACRLFPPNTVVGVGNSGGPEIKTQTESQEKRRPPYWHIPTHRIAMARTK